MAPTCGWMALSMSHPQCVPLVFIRRLVYARFAGSYCGTGAETQNGPLPIKRLVPRMRLYYPRSFLKLLFVGFALVALPLMFALINNAISLDALAHLSQKAVCHAVQATESSGKLAELIPQMERVAHQMLILGERSLLDTYSVHRKQLLATAQEFASLPFDSGQRTALREIVEQEASIYQMLSNPASRPEDLQQAVKSFVGL